MGSRLARGSPGLGTLAMSLCCSVCKWGEPRPTKMEAVHRLRKIKQERLEDALDAMWRAKGTAFQAKGTANRKVLRLEGARHMLGPQRTSACGRSSRSGQDVGRGRQA